ncbi:MAG: hypothetical protein AMXMBFR84_28750 [Candidatus Hydrogenedentota bacterium]
MNLEKLEQRCLAYLKQVSHPFVSLDRLGEYVRRLEEFNTITDNELREFLSKHELFEVFDPVGLASDPETSTLLAAEGIPVAPVVVLCTRVPSESQLTNYVETVLETLQSAMKEACRDAQERGQSDRARRIVALIDRTQVLREKLRKFL